MLNRGRRSKNQHVDDFARVEALRGDRSTPEAVAALAGVTGRYVCVSSTGVYWSYHTVDITEAQPVVLEDTPAQTPPRFGVMKAQSERAVRDGLPGRELIIRPGYLVGSAARSRTAQK